MHNDIVPQDREITSDTRPIRLGMVGGGQGALIGKIHRFATRLDGHYSLVAGVLSSTADRSLQSGLAIGLDVHRCYGTYQDMIAAETHRPDGIEAVCIVTPNHLHAPLIDAFLTAGIHVFCDKPMTATLAQAERLQQVVKNANAHLVVTYNYSANALIRQARTMVANGDLGHIRTIHCTYPQDSLSRADTARTKQALWRQDPALCGAGTVADLGTHCYQLMTFVSGLQATGVFAQLTTFGENRLVDDDVQVLLDFETGAKGMLWASQIADGGEHGLTLKICGTKGSIEWQQENADKMLHTAQDKPAQILTRAGVGGKHPHTIALSRAAAGHPEGYIEAFANIYTDTAPIIKAHRHRKQKSGQKMPLPAHIPSYQDGLNGMRFIDACQKSSAGKTWVDITPLPAVL